MKNKLKKTMTALCAALILMGGFSVPAYAQGAATEPPAEDATNDSGVIVEEKEETPPLTPKGNATLVDDYGCNKQLITVTTKSGNYFYILIDRAAVGEQTVHFLNQVDEADLMALTENGDTTKKPEVCNCTEKEAGVMKMLSLKLRKVTFGFLQHEKKTLTGMLCENGIIKNRLKLMKNISPCFWMEN